MGAVVLLVLLGVTVGVSTREEKAWPFYGLAALGALFSFLGLYGLSEGRSALSSLAFALGGGAIALLCVRAGNARRGRRPPAFVTSKQMFPPGTVSDQRRTDDPPNG